MHSYTHFRPGANKKTSRIIQYTALKNGVSEKQCNCIPDQYNKNVPGSNSPSVKVSNAMRLSQIIRSNRGGGSLQYGNFYLGQPLDINYLGRMAGMPGGSGMPPVNRFN